MLSRPRETNVTIATGSCSVLAVFEFPGTLRGHSLWPAASLHCPRRPLCPSPSDSLPDRR